MKAYDLLTMWQSLPHSLYLAEQIRELEHKACKQLNLTLFQLMRLAGEAVATSIIEYFPLAKSVLVVAGPGNNGGDAFITAQALIERGVSVELFEVSPTTAKTNNRDIAREKYQGKRLTTLPSLQQLKRYDVIVDGLLGIGVNRPLSVSIIRLIERLNRSSVAIVAIDLPSGLHSDTGAIEPVGINATMTVVLLARKIGLYSGIGKSLAGRLIFVPLVDEAIIEGITELTDDTGGATSGVTNSAALVSFSMFKPLPSRAINCHKSQCGKLLCIGGSEAMPGAIAMAATAAAKVGTGVVKVYTDSKNFPLIVASQPELMCVNDSDLPEALEWSDAILIGPGLSCSEQAKSIFTTVMAYLVKSQKPVVIDADGLNLLAGLKSKVGLKNAILTPHHGEVARLLGCNVAMIEQNRHSAVNSVLDEYGGYLVLKGPGTVISGKSTVNNFFDTDQGIDSDSHQQYELKSGQGNQQYICQHGNPALASAGTGDVLAGVIAGLLAQGTSPFCAALYGAVLHGFAADLRVEKYGQRGMLATDLYKPIQQLINGMI